MVRIVTETLCSIEVWNRRKGLYPRQLKKNHVPNTVPVSIGTKGTRSEVGSVGDIWTLNPSPQGWSRVVSTVGLRWKINTDQYPPSKTGIGSPEDHRPVLGSNLPKDGEGILVWRKWRWKGSHRWVKTDLFTVLPKDWKEVSICLQLKQTFRIPSSTL